MAILGSGCTRIALRLGRFVVKLPNVRYGWRATLKGLLHNMEEAMISRWLVAHPYEPGADRICPVLLACPGGFFNVMPWCEPVLYGSRQAMEEWDAASPDEWWTSDTVEIEEMTKDDNIGWLRDRLVTFDYASTYLGTPRLPSDRRMVEAEAGKDA